MHVKLIADCHKCMHVKLTVAFTEDSERACALDAIVTNVRKTCVHVKLIADCHKCVHKCSMHVKLTVDHRGSIFSASVLTSVIILVNYS